MNVLIVEDHLMTIKGYGTLLEETMPEVSFLNAFNCQEAYLHIKTTPKLDLAIIDYQLPAFEVKKLYSGIDVALKVKRHHPNCLICIITAYEEATTIYDIHSKAQPNALIVKSDFKDFKFIKYISSRKTYLSRKVQEAIKAIDSSQLFFEDKNREIVVYLKQGFRISDIASTVELSQSAVEKRITKMREYFGATDRNDLIKKATEENII